MSILRPDQDRINRTVMRERHIEADMDRLAALSREAAIPKADALRLCHEICHERVTQWYSPAAWRCAACVLLAKDGVPARMVTGHPGYFGCPAVNQRYLMERRKALAHG